MASRLPSPSHTSGPASGPAVLTGTSVLFTGYAVAGCPPTVSRHQRVCGTSVSKVWMCGCNPAPRNACSTAERHTP